MRRSGAGNSHRADDHAHQHLPRAHALPCAGHCARRESYVQHVTEPLDTDQTVTNRHTRIAPTRPYSRHEIFSLGGRPDAAGTGHSRDRTVAHIRLRQVRRVGQMAGRSRHDGARIGTRRGRAHGAQRAIGRRRQRSMLLATRQARRVASVKSVLATVLGKCAETEQERRQQRKDPAPGTGAAPAPETAGCSAPVRARQIRRAQRREDERQPCQRRAGDGHAQRKP